MPVFKPNPILIAGVLLSFCLIHLTLVGLHCFSYYDLGIYSEALRRINLHDWNPFIPGRNIRIFSDHFDPILIPFSFFENWIKAPYLGILLEFLSLALCWIPIKRLIKKDILTPELAVFSYSFILLNAATIDALNWPFHPTTWACFPLVCVFSFYLLQDWKALFASLILLFSCREEFPLLGLTLGLVLLYDKKTRPAINILSLSILWLGFVFFLRPKIWGSTSEYGGNLLHSFLTDPLAPLKKLLHFDMLRMFLTRTVPLLLFLNVKTFKKHFKYILKILIIASPLLTIRYASHQWAFHYGTAAIICFLFIFVPLLRDSSVSVWRRNLAWLITGIIFLSPVVKDGWDAYLSEGRYRFGHHRCPLDQNRLENIENAQKWIEESKLKKILTLNSLSVGQILHSDSKNQEVHILHPANNLDPGIFDVVLVEKPPRGDGWMATPERILALIEIWRNTPGVQVVMDNEFLFLAKGPITPDR